MSLIDAENCLIWDSVAATENTHDSTLLQSTDLWRNIVEGNVFPNQGQKVVNIEIPPLISENGAFLLRTWIMKIYGDAILLGDKCYFNKVV